VRQAEGEYDQRVKKAQAEADSFKLLEDLVKTSGGLDVLKMRLSQDYINSMSSLAKGGNKLILP